MTTLFVADCHLSPKRPEIVKLFCHFLNKEASKAQRLFILGDLFDLWLGDDDPAQGLEDVIARLRSLSSSTPIYFMPGNHDFLAGEGFALRTRCQLINQSSAKDYSVIDLYGRATLLMHGDQLCTDDVAYQRYRAIVRNPITQALWRVMSLKQRQFLANKLSFRSKHATAKKPETIMDVNQKTVEKVMAQHGVYHLIHGHVHRPAIHHFTLDGKPAQRIVLGDWYEQGSVLEISDNGTDLRQLN